MPDSKGMIRAENKRIAHSRLSEVVKTKQWLYILWKVLLLVASYTGLHIQIKAFVFQTRRSACFLQMVPSHSSGWS
jgi:hypothetical protein